jgi:hypothetical protein
MYSSVSKNLESLGFEWGQVTTWERPFEAGFTDYHKVQGTVS